MSTPRPIAVSFGFSEVLPSAPKYPTLVEDEVLQRIRFFHLIVAVSKKGNIPLTFRKDCSSESVSGSMRQTRAPKVMVAIFLKSAIPTVENVEESDT